VAVFGEGRWMTEVVMGTYDAVFIGGRVRELPGIAVTVQNPLKRFVPLARKWSSSKTTCLEM
jgi:hypothetical protein